jgi:transcriptional regulator GlxA family with amidase domain
MKGEQMNKEANLLCRRIDALVSANPCVTLPDLAGTIGVDRRKIERAIRERYGYGFRELKNRARLNVIAAFLNEERPRMLIKNIAVAVGVTPNALSRFIRSMTGRCARELLRNNTRNAGRIRRSAMQPTPQL